MHLTELSKVISEHRTIFYLLNISEVSQASLISSAHIFYAIIAILYNWGYKMKLILDTENSHPTTITVKGKEMALLLIESSILIDSSQIAKLFDKKEKTVATKVQKSKLEKYETENVKLLKNYGLMNPDAVKPRPFYDLRQMLEGPAQYYFKQIDELDLIDVIVRVAIGKHREWIHNRNVEKF